MAKNFDDMMFRIRAEKIRKAMNSTIPREVKELGVSFFKGRFRSQGWLDTGFHPWRKRKKLDKKRPGRNILMDRGKLRNSIRGEVRGGDIIFGSDRPYAKVHNEGGTVNIPARTQILHFKKYKSGKRKGKTLFARNNAQASFGQKVENKGGSFQMPKRQFMGESKYLTIKIKSLVDKHIKQILKL